MRIGIFLALMLFARFSLAAEPALPPGLMQLDGRHAPELKLSDMDGKETDLSKLRGHWVMVHFWATWCGPCRQEMPTIQRMIPQLPASRLTVILVNTAERDDDVFMFLPAVAPDLITLMDRNGKVTERWQPRGLPSTFLVDPKGRLRYLALGGRVWDAPPYLEFLQKLVK